MLQFSQGWSIWSTSFFSFLFAEVCESKSLVYELWRQLSTIRLPLFLRIVACAWFGVKMGVTRHVTDPSTWYLEQRGTVSPVRRGGPKIESNVVYFGCPLLFGLLFALFRTCAVSKYKTPKQIWQSVKPDTGVFAKLLCDKNDFSFVCKFLNTDFSLTGSGICTDNCKVQRWN